jgi:serine/threonine-protein kinase HipA
MEVAPYFRVPNTQANTIKNKVIETVKDWRKIAAEVNIPRSEQEVISTAFKVS